MPDEAVGGTQGAAAQPTATPAPTNDGSTIKQEASAAKPINDTTGDQPQPKEYLGSEKVNPKQRPLKAFDRRGMTKEAIDAFIREAGPDIYLPDDAGKEDSKEKPADNKADEKAVEEDKEIADFLEKSGLSKDEAAEIPEKLFGKIQKIVEEKGTKGKLYEEVNTKYTQLKTDADTLLNDAVVAARAEELATGKAYVATKVQPVSMDEVGQIEALVNDGNQQGVKDLVDKIIKERAQDAIKHERSVIDKRTYKDKIEKDSYSVIREMGKIDKRLAISEQDVYAVSKENHAEYKLVKEITDFLKANDYSKEQIIKMGPKKIYAAYAAEKGWDKEAAQRIEENTKKTLFDKLRQPSKANTLGMGQPSGSAGDSLGNSGFSKAQLIDQIGKGELTNYNRLLQAADAKGDSQMIRLLGELRKAGELRSKEKEE